MKTPSLAVGLLLLAHVTLAGEVHVNRVKSDEMLLQIPFEEHQFSFHRSRGYDYVDVRDMVLIPDAGMPALPWKAVHVAIPFAERAEQIEVTRRDEVVLGDGYRVVPVQPPAVMGTEPARWVDGRPEVYGSDSFYPDDPVGGVREGFIGENRVLSFIICPLRWNPANGSLKLARRIDVRISLRPDSRPRRLRRSGGGPQGLSKLAGSVVVNPSDMLGFAPPPGDVSQTMISELEEGYYEYVLITADSMAFCFEPLLEWKRHKGVPSKCVTREWIEASYTGSDPQEQIRNFIKDAYANWGTLWVLLGGDTAVVPSRHCIAMKISAGPGTDPVACDLYFADLDGTWNADGDGRYGEVADSIDMYPDIVVGRASVENASEAQVFVNKVLTYERNPPSDYVFDILMAGEVMWNDPYTDSGIGLDLIDADCIPPRFDPILKLYESRGNESRETVLAAMNAGQHLVFHGGHGSGHALYVGRLVTDVIENEDADTLTNGPHNFILNSIACVPACIDADGIAERLVHSPEGGCVAFIGNSHVGWGCPGHSGFGYSDRFQYEFAELVFVHDVVNLGLAHSLSKVPFVPFAGERNVYRFCEYELLLLGDPEMPVWTGLPLALDVDHPDSVMASGDDVAIGVRDANGAIQGARVCMLNDTDLYMFADTDRSGMAVFPVSTASSDSILLTVTAHNHLPFQIRIGVSPGGRRLAWCTYEVVDGNDGKPNPGETVGLRLCIKNHGDETAQGVGAIVRAGDSMCVVVDSTAIFGDAAPGIEVWSVDTLGVELAQTVANGDVVTLEVEIADDSPQTWTSRLPVVVATPLVSVLSQGVQETAGDGDQVVEPGEDILLTLKILNSGLTAAPGTEAFVSTIDPYLSVQDSTSLAGDIDASAHGLSLHRVQVSSMCPEPYVGVIEVDLWVSGMKEATDTVYLNIGTITFADDCESGIGGWTHAGTPDLWHLSSYRSHSGTCSWYFGGEVSRRYPNDAEGVLTSESILAGEASSLSFWAWYEVSTYGVDGVFVVLFQNGVPDTLDFIGSGGALATGPWDTLITRSDWVEWERTLDDVVPGDTLKIAFNFVSDGDTVAEGIYIDDISLNAKEPVITGVGEEAIQPVPAEIAIRPNPAFGSVVFVTACQEKRLEVDIYDIQGRLIAEVTKPAGRTSAVWDLRNRHGIKVAPGIYLARIRSAHNPHLKKIAVLR